MPTDMDDPQQELALADERSHPERPQTNKRQTRLILLGSAILQLPIWGFAMTFGIFQEAYSHSPHLHNTATSIIGTTTNGVMYLLMPLLFTALDRGPWSYYRRLVASTGICLSSLAFLSSSWSTQLWHLILTQGILAALGNTLIYSPTTLYLDEYFPSTGRATAYGAVLASKNIVGTCCPVLFSTLITHLGFAWTLRIWALVVLLTATLGLSLLPTRHHHHHPSSPPTSPSSPSSSSTKVPWTFLSHRTIYIQTLSNILFATGYGLPQTYLPLYARETSFSHYSPLTSALLLTLFNAPGIISCLAFARLSDTYHISSSVNTSISAFGSASTAIFLWGLATSHTHPSLLITFSILFGFFAGGYSSTWGGWITELEAEAEEHGEEIQSGVVYGLFNGARGVGYLVSGWVGVELLKDGGLEGAERCGFGTRFGKVILFTGVSCAVGGWGVVWTGWKWMRGRLQHIMIVAQVPGYRGVARGVKCRYEQINFVADAYTYLPNSWSQRD